MSTGTQSRRADGLSAFFAGLQAGMLGALSMLAWLGVAAKWKRLGFWTAENLMATFFYRDGDVSGGFSGRTVSGLALYLLLYSLLGAVFALAVRGRLPRLRVVLVGLLFGLAWYYVSYQWLWKGAAPLVAMLHPVRQTLVGHLIFGTLLGRFPAYLPGPREPEEIPR